MAASQRDNSALKVTHTHTQRVSFRFWFQLQVSPNYDKGKINLNGITVQVYDRLVQIILAQKPSDFIMDYKTDRKSIDTQLVRRSKLCIIIWCQNRLDMDSRC